MCDGLQVDVAVVAEGALVLDVRNDGRVEVLIFAIGRLLRDALLHLRGDDMQATAKLEG